MRRILSIAGLVVALAGFIPTDSGAECPTGLPGSGSGDVTGPASSTDNAVVRFDGTGGKTLQDSACTVSDGGRLDCVSGGGSLMFYATTSSANWLKNELKNSHDITGVVLEAGSSPMTHFEGTKDVSLRSDSRSDLDSVHDIYLAQDGTGSIGDDLTPDAQWDIDVGDAARVGQVIDLAASQTADAFQINDSTGESYFRIYNTTDTVSYALLGGAGNTRWLQLKHDSVGNADIRETGYGPVHVSNLMSEYGNGSGQYARPLLFPSLNTTAVSTTAVVTEEDLITYTTPIYVLGSTAGRYFHIKTWGTTAANANTKTMRLYFGSTVVASITGALNNKDWHLEADVVRTGTNTQDASGRGFVDGVAPTVTFSTPTETESGAITIKVTGQNGTASAGDITAEALLVQFGN